MSFYIASLRVRGRIVTLILGSNLFGLSFSVEMHVRFLLGPLTHFHGHLDEGADSGFSSMLFELNMRRGFMDFIIFLHIRG